MCYRRLLKKQNRFLLCSWLVVRNNYFDLKNTCFCKSKRLHGFGEYYCEKLEQILIKYYSFYACPRSSKACLHSDGLSCNSCFNKFFCLPDTIKTCIPSIHLRNKGSYGRYRNFNITEAGGFLQSFRRDKKMDLNK